MKLTVLLALDSYENQNAKIKKTRRHRDCFTIALHS